MPLCKSRVVTMQHHPSQLILFAQLHCRFSRQGSPSRRQRGNAHTLGQASNGGDPSSCAWEQVRPLGARNSGRADCGSESQVCNAPRSQLLRHKRERGNQPGCGTAMAHCSSAEIGPLIHVQPRYLTAAPSE